MVLKVPTMFGPKGDKGVDSVLDFLNTPTQQSLSYVVDSLALYPFLVLPSLDLLAIHHHLKEQLLHFLGLFDFANSASVFAKVLKKLSPPRPCDHAAWDGFLCFHSFSFKSASEAVKQTAQLLGATCILLRMEAVSTQSAPNAREALIYAPDVVGTHILTVKGVAGIDQTLLRILLRSTSSTSGQSTFRRRYADPIRFST